MDDQTLLEDFKADIEDFKKELNPEEVQKIGLLIARDSNVKIIDIITALDKKSADTVEALFEFNKTTINSSLEFRSRNEKIDLINLRRSEIFTSMADENKRGIMHVLDMPLKMIPELVTKILEFLPSIKEQIPESINMIAEADFVAHAVPLVNSMENATEETLTKALKTVISLTEKFPALEKYVTAKRPLRTAIFSAIFTYYDKHVLTYLNGLLDELERPQIPQSNLEKIEWMGTQKELAELFVELEKKGWIREKKVNLIKAYFTKSDTIHQVLKPTQDSKTKEKGFDGIYTTSYKPNFDTIKAIKTSVK